MLPTQLASSNHSKLLLPKFQLLQADVIALLTIQQFALFKSADLICNCLQAM